ncbi:YgcG family protein [Aestuariivivens sp. NBU2969]|uniref:TPM domain-containing protein n=1 Tax=Aestuariivivens sp. NBU2969 TaxID=2873267 RepID=UPI001CC17FCB|nr:TPM domain-containing protein [Aestuariivivens sp. NBU2969]
MGHLKINTIKYFKTSTKVLVVAFIFSLSSFKSAFAQFEIPEKPDFQTSVYDYVDLLSASERNNLENKLIKYSDTTSTQIVVAIISTTKGENIGLLAPRWGHTWGVGQAKEDNGIFILLAKDDRKIWIAPGYGVEHKLTAGITGEVIRKVIIPEFKKGDYYNGLSKGADTIFQLLNGEYQGSRKQSGNNDGLPIGFIMMLIIIFIIILISISKNRHSGGKGGNRGGKSNGLDIWDMIILSNMGRSSGRGNSGWGNSGGGFSGGGGFGGGFGGGGFSGGGAGGSW